MSDAPKPEEGDNKPAGVEQQKAKDPANVAGQPRLQDKAPDQTQQVWDAFGKQLEELQQRNVKAREKHFAAQKAQAEKGRAAAAEKKQAPAPNKGLEGAATAENAPSAGGDSVAGAATAAAGPVGTTGSSAMANAGGNAAPGR